MNALEKAALDDPFLTDALEGYATEGVNIPADIAELKKRLQEKTGQSKVIPLKKGRTPYPFLRIAAILVLVISAGLLTYRLGFTNKSNELAQVKSEPAKTNDTSLVTTPVTGTEETSSPVNTITPGKNEQPAERISETGADKATPVTPIQQNHEPVAETSRPQPNAAVAKEDVAVVKDRIATDKEHTKEKAIAGAKASNQKPVLADDEQDTKKVLARQGKEEKTAPNRQTNVFYGRVTDADNIGVPFANVTNIADNVGTYTNADGYFNLTSPDTILNVQVRSIGFENNQVELRNLTPNTQVVLQEDRNISSLVLNQQRPNAEARSRRGNITMEEPEPADGWTNYDTYLANNLNVPEDYNRSGKQTTPGSAVEVSFEVDTNGNPVNIRIEKSLCGKCDTEAIRLIKEGPKWKGKPRVGRTTVTVSF